MIQIKYYADRQLNKDQIERLATNEYMNRHENLIIVSATGNGKSYIARALGVEACNAILKVMYVRLPDLLAELDLAKVQENCRKRINQYIKCDFLYWMSGLRYGLIMPNSRIFLKYWKRVIVSIHQYTALSLMLQDSTVSFFWGGCALADAIMDRIISKLQTIKIFGDKSMRSR